MILLAIEKRGNKYEITDENQWKRRQSKRKVRNPMESLGNARIEENKPVY